MELFEAMRARRSVRKFLDRDVDDAMIEAILEAARWAPTGGNMQPWEFIVVRSPEQKRRLVDCTYSGYLEKGGSPQKWILAAPVVLVVCINQKRTGSRYGESGRRIALMDTSAAIQNVLLAIVSVGLASCWVSGFVPEGIAEAIRLPRGVEPVALLPVGYPAGLPPAPPKLPVEDFAFRERYGERLE